MLVGRQNEKKLERCIIPTAIHRLKEISWKTQGLGLA